MKVKCSGIDCHNEVDVTIGVKLCTSCWSQVEEACIRSLENFGTPEVLGCSECGHFFRREDYIKHLPCWEELDAYSKDG